MMATFNHMKFLARHWITLVVTAICIQSSFREVCAQVKNQNDLNISTYKEILDPVIGLSLQWTVNKNDNSLIFNVEAYARQIFIGLTNRGQVNGSDVIVCGVTRNGAPFVYDMYGMSNKLILDSRQDWRLISGSVSTGKVQIEIRRNFSTCDEQDVAINNNLIDVIWDWSINRNDQRLPRQINPKGLKPIYFLDPYILPVSANFNPESQVRVSRRFTIPPKRTTYWCSIHKLNVTFQTPHHIYGFSAFFGNEVARRHIHHQLLYRCYPPAPGIDFVSIFEPFINHPGEECYLNHGPRLPTAWCREKVHIFALGAEPVKLPDSVGLTIGETSIQYFMLETHYDNPDLRSDLTIENGADLQYSSRRRPNDGSIIFVGHGILGTFIMPPLTPAFNIVGHCSKDCLAKMVPAGGVDIVGVALHAHTSARSMRLRHFRGNTESWISSEEDYRFDFQQLRFLQNPVTILPGDKLTMECTYDTTWRNGSAVLSGFSTTDEMCMAFLVLNKQIPYLYCSSEYPTQRTMNKYGIQNMTWDIQTAERIINAADNPSLLGARLSQIVESQVWTSEAILELEQEQKYGMHVTSCPNTRNVGALAYLAMQLAEISGGLLQLPLVEQSVPTSRTMDSPFAGLVPATYPTLIPAYVPPENSSVCEL